MKRIQRFEKFCYIWVVFHCLSQASDVIVFSEVAALKAELSETRAALAFEKETTLQLRSMLNYKKMSSNATPNLPSMQASKLSLIAVNQLAGHVLGQLDCSGGDRPVSDFPNAVHMSNSLGTSRMILKSISRFVQSLASRFAPIDLGVYTRYDRLLITFPRFFSCVLPILTRVSDHCNRVLRHWMMSVL